MPGVLKNAIDWVSRFRPQPFNERHGLLLSASPSMVGGNRGLWALRVPFEHLGARLYPDMFSLAQAHQAFDGDGRIANEQLQERFDDNVANFMDLVEASKHYPCIKSAWVEYLGEHPEPAIRPRARSAARRRQRIPVSTPQAEPTSTSSTSLRSSATQPASTSSSTSTRPEGAWPGYSALAGWRV